MGREGGLGRVCSGKTLRVWEGVMNDFETIIATALIGTERQALPSLTLEPNLSGSSREATLLSAAALVTQYRKAARVPVLHPATLEPSGADLKPELPANLRSLLERLLNGHQELLSEFLELTSSYRFAHRDLPRMLELGRGNTALRAGLLNGLDTRGRWLAGMEKAGRGQRAARKRLKTR